MNLRATALSFGFLVFVCNDVANAAIVNVTGATLRSAFLAAQPGDTLRVTGVVGDVKLSNRTFASKVTIDASNATFTNSLVLENIKGVTILGGTFGSSTAPTRQGKAIAVFGGGNIVFSKNTFIGYGLGTGLTVTRARDVVVSAAKFKNLKLGASVVSSTNVRVSSSHFTGMSSDGLNIVDSHFVTAKANRCTDAVVLPGSGFHMDCIQLWSLLGNPVQSDISLLNNYVSGPMQGLTSFTPQNGGGLRISIIGNIVSTSMPQGIACYGCVDSIITNNILTTLPGSQWRTSLNVIGGRNNIVENNSIGALANAAYLPPEPLIRDGMLSGSMGLMEGATGATAAIPDLNIWAQLLLGFVLTGTFMRRGKARLPVVAA